MTCFEFVCTLSAMDLFDLWGRWPSMCQVNYTLQRETKDDVNFIFVLYLFFLCSTCPRVMYSRVEDSNCLPIVIYPNAMNLCSMFHGNKKKFIFLVNNSLHFSHMHLLWLTLNPYYRSKKRQVDDMKTEKKKCIIFTFSLDLYNWKKLYDIGTVPKKNNRE